MYERWLVVGYVRSYFNGLYHCVYCIGRCTRIVADAKLVCVSVYSELVTQSRVTYIMKCKAAKRAERLGSVFGSTSCSDCHRLYFSELISGCFRATHLCILTSRLLRNLLLMLCFVNTKIFPIVCIIITACVRPTVGYLSIPSFHSEVTSAAAHLLQFLIAVQSPDVHARPSAAHPCYVASVPSA